MRLLFLALLSACQHAPPAEVASLPSTPRRCTVVVVADAKAAVTRLSGGAFVLREDGALERYDRDGRLTGSVPTPLEGLAPAGAYVCGPTGGKVACFRDRHEELTCPSAPFAPELEVLPISAGGTLRGDPEEPLLSTEEGVWEIGGTCEQHCVTLGCDEPRRCMDPCPAGEAPEILSKRRPARVTHPS